METSLHLSKLIFAEVKDELLYLSKKRAMIIPIKSFGVLQRDLIANIGIDRMKRFFFQYGWNLGKEDAKSFGMDLPISLLDKILYGPHFHAAQGHAKVRVTDSDITLDNGKVNSIVLNGIWEQSYEASQHIENFGLAEEPICYTLTGYASGYTSALVGQNVFFKEHQCEGEGAPHCVWEGRLVTDWEEESSEHELFFNADLPILKELEQINELLIREKNMLSLVTNIHTELTAELIKGNNLNSILEIAHIYIKKPIIVEDIHHQIIASKGITNEQCEPLKKEFITSLKKWSLTKIEIIHHGHSKRLAAPIYLQNKIIGYCSFIIETDVEEDFAIETMIIGRLSSICSLVLLNEKNKVESNERLKGLFLEEILSGKYKSGNEIISKAGLIQLDLTQDYNMILLSYQHKNNSNQEDFTIHSQMFEVVSDFLKDKEVVVLMEQWFDGLLLLMPENQINNHKNIVSAVEELLEYLKNRFRQLNLYMGISTKSNDLTKAAEVSKEASAAVKLSTDESPITHFSDLGILGILISNNNKNAIRKIAEETLGCLYENMDSGKAELLETLYHFLVNGGNLEITSEKLMLSISGLRYRLNKITNLLGYELRNPEIQFQLLLSLKAIKIIGEGWKA